VVAAGAVGLKGGRASKSANRAERNWEGRARSRPGPHHKPAIVVAIKDGTISTARAKKQYDLSNEELAAWMRDHAAHGWPGLSKARWDETQRAFDIDFGHSKAGSSHKCRANRWGRLRIRLN